MLPEDTKERVMYPDHPTEAQVTQGLAQKSPDLPRSDVLQESRESIPKCHQVGQGVMSGVVQKACSGCWWNWVQGATYGMGTVLLSDLQAGFFIRIQMKCH